MLKNNVNMVKKLSGVNDFVDVRAMQGGGERDLLQANSHFAIKDE